MGLCIILHDIVHVEDSYILPGDGASHTKGIVVLFRFRWPDSGPFRQR